MRRWHRDGLLTPNQAYSWKWTRNDEVIASVNVQTELGQIILTYQHQRGENGWENESYSVRLDWSECNFGGVRPWFLCPAMNCNRRVAILYGGSIFACRHCHRLAYESQREASYDRAARRVNKIRERLRWKLGIFNPKGWQKPKGMHWNTFARLNKEHDTYAAKSLAGINSRLNSILRLLHK